MKDITNIKAAAALLAADGSNNPENNQKAPGLRNISLNYMTQLAYPMPEDQRHATKGSPWLNSLYEIFPGGYHKAREIIKKMSCSTKQPRSSLNWERHILGLCELVDLLSFKNQCDIYQLIFDNLSSRGFKLKVNPVYTNKFSHIFSEDLFNAGQTTDQETKSERQLMAEQAAKLKLDNLKDLVQQRSSQSIDVCDWSVLDLIDIKVLLAVYKDIVGDVKTDFAIAISNHIDYAELDEDSLNPFEKKSLKNVKRSILGHIDFSVVENNNMVPLNDMRADSEPSSTSQVDLLSQAAPFMRSDSDPIAISQASPLRQVDDLVRADSESDPSSLSQLGMRPEYDSGHVTYADPLSKIAGFGKSFGQPDLDRQLNDRAELDTAWLEVTVSNKVEARRSLLQIFLFTKVYNPDVGKALTEILVDQVLKYELQGTSSAILPVSKTLEDIALFLWASEMKQLPSIMTEDKLKLYQLFNPRLTCFVVDKKYIKSFKQANKLIDWSNSRKKSKKKLPTLPSHIFKMLAASKAYIEKSDPSKRDWKLTLANDTNGLHYMLTHRDAHISVDSDHNLKSRSLSLGLHWTTWGNWTNKVINMCPHISMDWKLILNFGEEGKVKDGGVLKVHDFNFGYSLESYLANPSDALRLPSYNAPELVEQSANDAGHKALYNYLRFITVNTNDSKDCHPNTVLLAKLLYIAKGYHHRALERLQCATWLAGKEDTQWTQLSDYIEQIRCQVLPLQDLADRYARKLEAQTSVSSMTILAPDQQPGASWVKEGLKTVIL